jgi:hypothetical protein
MFPQVEAKMNRDLKCMWLLGLPDDILFVLHLWKIMNLKSIFYIIFENMFPKDLRSLH